MATFRHSFCRISSVVLPLPIEAKWKCKVEKELTNLGIVSNTPWTWPKPLPVTSDNIDSFNSVIYDQSLTALPWSYNDCSVSVDILLSFIEISSAVFKGGLRVWNFFRCIKQRTKTVICIAFAYKRMNETCFYDMSFESCECLKIRLLLAELRALMWPLAGFVGRRGRERRTGSQKRMGGIGESRGGEGRGKVGLPIKIPGYGPGNMPW